MQDEGHLCHCKYSMPTEIQARSAKLDSKPFNIEICTPTLYVKVQIMAEDRKVPRDTMVKVCPYSHCGLPEKVHGEEPGRTWRTTV